MDKLIEHLKKRAVSPLRDFGMILALLLINGFYYCEGKYPVTLMDPLRLCFALLMMISLLGFGFWSGVLRRLPFALFLASCWILPQAGDVLLVSYSEVKGWGRMLYDLSRLLGEWPFATLAHFVGLSSGMTASLIFVASLAAFGFGWILRERAHQSKSLMSTKTASQAK